MKRIIRWLTGASAITAACALSTWGCSSSSDGTPSNTDGGSDATADATRTDAGGDGGTTEAGPSDASCAVDANLLATTDAAADSSTATCQACLGTKCRTQFEACNNDCTCKTAVVTIAACSREDGGSVGACLIELASTQPTLISGATFQALSDCQINTCSTACNPAPAGDAGADAATDATSTDAGDAQAADTGTDAAGDAGADARVDASDAASDAGSDAASDAGDASAIDTGTDAAADAADGADAGG